jgi:benzil reductase ((S)-benzoin forming)
MPDSPSLAIVTGTSSGIGAAVARLLLADEWTVVGLSRRPVDFGDSRYHDVDVDLGDIAALRDATDRHILPAIGSTRWRRIGLVNNAAATGTMAPMEDADLEGFAGLLAVNLVAPVFLMGMLVRAAPADIPLRLVNVSTGAAVQAFPGLGEYGSSKAGLRLASMTFAAEMTSPERPGGVRRDVAVLSYQPGIVDTPMQVTARAPRPHNRMFIEFHAQGRLVPPEAPAAEIVDFLRSDHPESFAERRYGVK